MNLFRRTSWPYLMRMNWRYGKLIDPSFSLIIVQIVSDVLVNSFGVLFRKRKTQDRSFHPNVSQIFRNVGIRKWESVMRIF